jgi:hypothetical protein
LKRVKGIEILVISLEVLRQLRRRGPGWTVWGDEIIDEESA